MEMLERRRLWNVKVLYIKWILHVSPGEENKSYLDFDGNCDYVNRCDANFMRCKLLKIVKLNRQVSKAY